jgi:hypothetical protein
MSLTLAANSNASPLRRISSDSSLESRNHKAASIAKSSINRCSRDCSFIDDALRQGDIIGPGLSLQGEPVELIHIPNVPPRYGQPPALNLQVVRKLGAGSYAVVYLVREILDPLAPTDDAVPDRLGREYAIKCLSKVGYDADTLSAQMIEVSTLSRPLTLESSSSSSIHSTFRPLSTKHSPLTETLSLFIAHSKPSRTFSFSLSTFLAKISSTSSSRPVTMKSGLSPTRLRRLRPPRSLPLFIPTSYFPTAASASSPACFPKCAMLLPSVTARPSITVISSPRTLSSPPPRANSA